MHPKLSDERVNKNFARKAQAVLDDVKGHGYDIRPTQVFRTRTEQRKLYANGRSNYALGKKGYTVAEIALYRKQGALSSNAIVTSVLDSKHMHGLAMDVAFFGDDKLPIWNTSYEGWGIYGKACTAHNLVWGGIWKSFRDMPHCELKPEDI